MSDIARSVPSAAHLLAESVRRYRSGFPGVARAFLPVFAVFAAGQIGLTLLDEADSFPNLLLRLLVLAVIGILEVVVQALATAGLVASAESLPRASLREIYRAGAKVFWPSLWVTGLVALALSAAPIAALLVAPFAASASAGVAAALFGRTPAVVLVAALGAVQVTIVLAVVVALILVARLAFAFPLVARGRARGLAALERSAAFSDRRAWTVAGRLAAGIAAVGLAVAPFVAAVVSTSRLEGTLSVGAPWAWSLMAAAYFLVGVPFGAIYLVELARSLEDTEAERAAARGRRRWVLWLAWGAAAVWALWIAQRAS